MRRIYARNTEVTTVDNTIAQRFIKEHHRAENANPVTSMISLGLFSDDELVAVAQFCSPRSKRKKREYSTELLRLCFKGDLRVVGGASKLIKHYITVYSPADIFTYQDTTGENTNVYEECGFTLVSEDKTKSYLIAPGRTFEDAGRGEKLSVAYAAHLGPDNILGTSLGEVFKEDGLRKTNIELFMDLGWSLVKTSGDKVYEWVNPAYSFYVYKITALDSDKYYYGVRHLKKGDATQEDCLQDDYYGSGGRNNQNNKFVNWKKKHKNTLQKQIIKVFSRKAEAYLFEGEIIGDKWRTDPLCLNSVAGGFVNGYNNLAAQRVNQKECSVHGVVSHLGDSCAVCLNTAKVHVDECVKHGEVKFLGDVCYHCIQEKTLIVKECDVHGAVIHRRNHCLTCVAERTNTIDHCVKHGDSPFQGGKCYHCIHENVIRLQHCDAHGESKHRGSACMKCVAEINYTVKECDVHGEVFFIGEVCITCKSNAAITMRNCEVHGESKHIGARCYLCVSNSIITFKHCEVHGLVKHIGDACYRCRDVGGVIQNCPLHGDVYFTGDVCGKCRAAKNTVLKECLIHGVVLHLYDVCLTCRSNSSITMKDCVHHGESKHRGDVCCQCVVDDTNHLKFHCDEVGLPRRTAKNCYLCREEIRNGSRVEVLPLSAQSRVCGLCGGVFTPKSKQQLFCTTPHIVDCSKCGEEMMVTPRKGKTSYAHKKRCVL